MPYRNILLIDDDEDDQEIFLTAVKQVSNTVKCLAMSDAAVALAQLTDRLLSPDVIFLDLNMPRMNGQEFLSKIKMNSNLTDIPVIIFSTSSHLPTILLTKELGAADFITKPGRYEDLIKILRKYI